LWIGICSFSWYVLCGRVYTPLACWNSNSVHVRTHVCLECSVAVPCAEINSLNYTFKASIPFILNCSQLLTNRSILLNSVNISLVNCFKKIFAVFAVYELSNGTEESLEESSWVVVWLAWCQWIQWRCIYLYKINLHDNSAVCRNKMWVVFERNINILIV